jgi:anti-anti-sigma regulatory factor
LSGSKIKLKNILIQLTNKLTKFDENFVMMELVIDSEILTFVDISVIHQLFEIFNLINLRSKSLVLINFELEF